MAPLGWSHTVKIREMRDEAILPGEAPWGARTGPAMLRHDPLLPTTRFHRPGRCLLHEVRVRSSTTAAERPGLVTTNNRHGHGCSASHRTRGRPAEPRCPQPGSSRSRERSTRSSKPGVGSTGSLAGGDDEVREHTTTAKPKSSSNHNTADLHRRRGVCPGNRSAPDLRELLPLNVLYRNITPPAGSLRGASSMRMADHGWRRIHLLFAYSKSSLRAGGTRGALDGTPLNPLTTPCPGDTQHQRAEKVQTTSINHGPRLLDFCFFFLSLSLPFYDQNIENKQTNKTKRTTQNSSKIQEIEEDSLESKGKPAHQP